VRCASEGGQLTNNATHREMSSIPFLQQSIYDSLTQLIANMFNVSSLSVIYRFQLLR